MSTLGCEPTRFKRFQSGKIWFDKDAEIHVDGMKDDVVMEMIGSNVDRRFFALPLEEGSKGSRCFGLSDFSAEDLDEIMGRYEHLQEARRMTN